MSEQIQPFNELVGRSFSAPPKKIAPQVGAPLHRAFTPEMRGIDEKNRTIDFVASTEAVDVTAIFCA